MTGHHASDPARSDTAAPDAAAVAASAPEGTAPARRRRRNRIVLFALAVIAVIVVPLAINGLFTGAISNAENSLSAVPAAVVNNDTLLTTTGADGKQNVVFAGRGLVTELTGPQGAGFDWQVTNSKDAAKGLKDGSYYAVLTIPKDFSKQVSSQGTTSPSQGLISIKTDDAHGYLSGLVASTVASAVQAGFGNTITAQVVNGVYTSFGTVGTQLSDAATGATQLAGGAGSLSGGATQLADGATQLSSGVAQYTSGVSSLSEGLQSAADQTSEFGSNVTQYTQAVSSAAALLAPIDAAISAGQPLTAQQTTDLITASRTLAAIDPGSAALSSGANALESGIADAAAGAAQLDAGSAQLASGAAALAPGATQLATGATTLQTGAQTLADGLSTGATALKDNSFADPEAAAKVVAKPVDVSVSTENKVTNIGQVLSTIILPAGLWLGALAVFLFLRPLSAALLASSASTTRLTARVFGRASVFAAAQVLLVVGFLHLGLGVAWSALPATLSLSLMAALAFTAFHQFLSTAFGRIGTVVSLILFAVQLASTAGLYPVQLLSGPFQVLSAITPMSYVVDGVRGVLVGGSIGPVLVAFGVLAGMLLLSLLLSGVALARRRHPSETGWLTPARPRLVLRRPVAE